MMRRLVRFHPRARHSGLGLAFDGTFDRIAKGDALLFADADEGLERQQIDTQAREAVQRRFGDGTQDGAQIVDLLFEACIAVHRAGECRLEGGAVRFRDGRERMIGRLAPLECVQDLLHFAQVWGAR